MQTSATATPRKWTAAFCPLTATKPSSLRASNQEPRPPSARGVTPSLGKTCLPRPCQQIRCAAPYVDSCRPATVAIRGIRALYLCHFRAFSSAGALLPQAWPRQLWLTRKVQRRCRRRQRKRSSTARLPCDSRKRRPRGKGRKKKRKGLSLCLSSTRPHPTQHMGEECVQKRHRGLAPGR